MASSRAAQIEQWLRDHPAGSQLNKPLPRGKYGRIVCEPERFEEIVERGRRESSGRARWMRENFAVKSEE